MRPSAYFSKSCSVEKVASRTDSKKFRNFMSNNFTTIKSRLATLIYVVVPIILTQSIAVVATATIKFFPPQTSLLLDLY